MSCGELADWELFSWRWSSVPLPLWPVVAEAAATAVAADFTEVAAATAAADSTAVAAGFMAAAEVSEARFRTAEAGAAFRQPRVRSAMAV